jgi:hypothetical protein
MVAGQGPKQGEIVIFARAFCPDFSQFLSLMRSSLASPGEGRDHDSQTTSDFRNVGRKTGSHFS